MSPARLSCKSKTFNFSLLFMLKNYFGIHESFRCFSKFSDMKILNVAEKNDAAKNISALLSKNGAKKREGPSKFNKIYEFECEAFNRKCAMIMTSVSGHMINLNFVGHFRKWGRVNPIDLFEAPIQKVCISDPVKENLQKLIKFCNTLIIWTDCDREGENIGFEIIDACKEVKPNFQIYRARFSEITYESVKKALKNLDTPNRFLSEAVEARKELDLRIGAAFTRFQTIFLKSSFPQSSEIQLISYGSCQFPTLGFVVERFKSIAEFVPELFWQINVEHKVDDIKVNFEWKRHRLFDKLACEVILNKCMESETAKVEKVESKPKLKWRPKPLNTIDFEKLASKKLKINAKEALEIAESLYNKGFISYPRTETTIFPKELKLEPLVEAQTIDSNWGAFAAQVLTDGPNPFQGNKSDQAHPPIHPIKYTDSLNGNYKKIYDLIVRHFLACLSKHAEGLETTVEIVIGEENFLAKGLIITAKNYLDVYPFERWSEKEMPAYKPGDVFIPDISIKEGETSPPELLTEADLLSLMEKHGIGTDATQADHIETIKARLYVGLKNNKYFVPRTLGMALVESYSKIGYEIAKPFYRANLEADLLRISENKISKEKVLSRHLKIYKEIFMGVQTQLDSFFNTITTYLQIENVAPVQFAQKIESETEISKCKSCGESMILKKYGGVLHLECSRYPACQKSLVFPSSVISVTKTNTICETCESNARLLEVTFKTGNIHMPNNYIGCLECDEHLKKILTRRNTKQQNPVVANHSENERNDNDSGFCSASENLIDVVSANSTVPNCHCGHPAISLVVKKEGPNKNRTFYRCAKSKNSNPCNFFTWKNEDCSVLQDHGRRDEISVGENITSEEVRCYCATLCRRYVVNKAGANQGREFYCCSKSIQNPDRCSFFKWADDENSSSDPSKSAKQNFYQNSKLGSARYSRLKK